MRKLIVDKKYENKKVTNFILEHFPALNKNTLFKALRKKDIRINNVRIHEDVYVHTSDEISIYITDEYLLGECKIPEIEIVYEDENILVANKPNDLSVTEDSSSTITLTSILKEKYGTNINPCHRIDRNTKGLVLFAKNDIALHILLEKFKNQEIEKHYKALVYGIPKKTHAILEAFLFKDSKKSIVYISNEPKKNYLPIKTEYSILEKNKNNNTTLLDVNLHTGRTHQIRAHLAHIGFPIIGDGKYGSNEINKKFSKTTQELYAYKIIFHFTTDSGILNYLNGKQIIL